MKLANTLIVAAILAIAALGGPSLARSQPYSVWDDGPLGLGHLVTEDRAGQRHLAGIPTVISQGRFLPSAAGEAVLVVEPRRGYDAAEVNALHGYLAGGGSALLMGTSPALAELLQRLGVGVTLGGPLYTPGFRSDGAFPIVEGLGGTWVLTAPRAVKGGTPLLTTGLAWEDLDADGLPDLGEPVGASTVASAVTLGRGQLLVVGSASPLTRDGWPAGPGPALLPLLTAGGERVLHVDEAHRAALDPLGLGGVLAGSRAGWVAPALVLAAGLLWALRPRVHRKDEGAPPPAGARMLVDAAREVRR